MKSRRWNARRSGPAAPMFQEGYSTENSRNAKTSRRQQKAKQLCRQVERALTLALLECGDPAIQDLAVLSVTPAPDVGRLLVAVRAPQIGAEQASSGPAEHLMRLEAVKGKLRSEVASAITRKRAPELIFRVLLPGEVMP